MKQNNKHKNGFRTISFLFCIVLLGLFSKLCAESDKEIRDLSSVKKTAIHKNKFSLFPEETRNRILQVAVFEEAPFAFRSKNTGIWEGISVAVWERVARMNNLSFKYIPVTKEEGEKGVSQKKYDLLLGTFPAFPEDGMQFEYTVPFYVAGMGFAVPEVGDLTFLIFLNHFLSWGFFKAITGLIFFVGTGAFLVYLCEREKNPDFCKKGLKGLFKALGNGFWWSSATVATVGYGDVLPKTFWGRFVGIIWMFTGVLMITGLMGSIASALTVGQLSTFVHDVKDLRKVTVVCVNETASKSFLSEHFIPCSPVNSLQEGLKEVEQNRAQALVYSEAILRYMVLENHLRGITIIPAGVSNQYYSFILPLKSDLLHPLNQAILRVINSAELKEILYTYLGYIPEVHS